ncbi:Elongation factor 1-alpha [Rhynchospora pubera]|uniref:Elongation factor 1-alpha n=1 Tax=Rhynchospora pubera TaxID=906938 RepID=A0AAV8E3U5_9POAL|nr:Elongation factor 1-alpha [Rhynchospora pubera]
MDIVDDFADWDFTGGEIQVLRSKPHEPPMKSSVWQCSVCTCYNDKMSTSCDICGVSRSSFIRYSSPTEIEIEVDSRLRKCELSKMARSLFSSKPQRFPKLDISYEDFQDFLRFGGPRRAYAAPRSKRCIHIVPFKFDTPSPDDVVSTGLKSAKTYLKAVDTSHLTKPPSGTKEKEKKTTNLSENISANSSTGIEEEAKSLSENLQKLNLEKDNGPIKTRKPCPKPQYKPEKWMLTDQELGSRSQLNLAIVGHVDSGKSTLCGRLLHLHGQISNNQIHKYEKEAKDKRKGSFAYAWAVDESSDERERGVTMTVSVKYFDSKNYHVVLLDSPGHKDFVPNLISGTAQADAAILVVDASIGAFEAGMVGMTGMGQTKEHAQIIRSFGLEHIIVAINKLDSVEYSQGRFDLIKLQLGSFLRSCGFKESGLKWVPLSTMENQNLVEPPSDVRLLSWYNGGCLLDAIDFIPPPSRYISKPLILPICDVISSRTLGQLAVSGKLEAGAIRVGSKVIVMPSGTVATVRTIERNGANCNVARAGDNVCIGLQNIGDDQLTSGGTLCHVDFPVRIASVLELKILVLEISTPILVGFQVEFHVHHAKASARVEKIISLIDQRTGEILKKAPRMLSGKQSAIIIVNLDREVCVEEFATCRALGRVFLRSSGSTIAVGIVNRILEQS